MVYVHAEFGDIFGSTDWYVHNKSRAEAFDMLTLECPEGGTLANPAEQFPSVFGRSAFLIHYPYALSTFAAGTFCLINTLAALFGIKETLNRPDAKSISAAPSPPLSTWSVLSSPGVPIVLYIYGHTMLLGLAYTAVSPVFLYTDVRNGGYGFTDQQIAMFLAGAGASQAMWMLLAFPPLQRRFGTGNVLRGCAVAWPFMMAAYPVGNELLRHKSYPVFWILFVITMVGGSGVSMGFGAFSLSTYPSCAETLIGPCMLQPASSSASTIFPLPPPS